MMRVGGPRRECFAIVMETLLLSSNGPQLFEGEDGQTACPLPTVGLERVVLAGRTGNGTCNCTH